MIPRANVTDSSPMAVYLLLSCSVSMVAPVVSHAKPTTSSSCLVECGSGSIWSKKKRGNDGQSSRHTCRLVLNQPS